MILQPLVLPCLSFFNTVPSGHLHLYTRHNNPRLALPFSSIMSILYFASAVVALAACSGSSNIYSLRGECPAPRSGSSSTSSNLSSGNGPDISQGFWNAAVALWLLSFVGYTLVCVMAVKVMALLRQREHAARQAGVSVGTAEMQSLDPDERARREQKARERWQRIVDL